jgi:hypothetical protein
MTVGEWIVASIKPLSPTTRVFSLEISPLNPPSMRTVSLKLSFPSKTEPWSMNAERFPAPPLADELVDVDTFLSRFGRPNPLIAIDPPSLVFVAV